MPAFLTTRDVAAHLAVDVEQVLGFIHRGDLRAIDVSARRGRRPRWRIRDEDLELFLAARAAIPQRAETRKRRRKSPDVIEFF
jgi:hypothetical protein